MIWTSLAAAGVGPCTNSRFAVLGSGIIYELDRDGQHFHVPVQLIGKQHRKEVVAMVDSGATTTFLSRRFVKENRVVTRKLATPIPLYNIDGTLNRDGTITDVAILELEIGAH